MARPRPLALAALVPAALLAFAAPPAHAAAGGRAGDATRDDEVLAAEEAGPDAPAERADPRLVANADDWFRAPARRGAADDRVADFPSAEVHDAVVANARAAAARAVFRRAESGLAAAVRNAQLAFKGSAELREAQAAEDRAYEAYEAARREALRAVVGDAKYQAMQDLRQNLARQIADRRVSADDAYARFTRSQPVSAGPVVDVGPSDSLVAMADLKLRVGADARAMERDALVDNDRVRQAREELAAASGKVAALRAAFDQKVREDGDLKKARESLEDARIGRVVAETYLKGADLAAGEALDFAYETHRYDYYRYNHYYDPGSYAAYYSYPLRAPFGYGYGPRGRR